VIASGHLHPCADGLLAAQTRPFDPDKSAVSRADAVFATLRWLLNSEPSSAMLPRLLEWGHLRLTKKTALLGVGMLVVAAAGCKREVPVASPPLKVLVLTASPRDVPIYQQWIGTLDGYPNAQIRAQVTGYLMKQDYAEGSHVKQSDLLFEIDPRPFQAALDQASAKLEQDQAMLGKTELDVKRDAPLVKQRAVSQEELDNVVHANLMAKAAVAADKAAVESARLNLSFTRITSPVDGIAGTAQAQIGDLLGPGSAVLTTVSTIDPIRAYFSISEQSYLAFCHQFTNAAERAASRGEMELQLILSDGSTYPASGKWLFTSRQVDVNTGTLQIAGLFPNPDYILRPGQYALVRAKIETRHGAILLPQRAVMELQGSYQVATVDAQNKAHIQSVQVGEQVGNDWLIEKGLAPNDRVVAEGTQRVKEGTVLDPQPYKTGTTNDVARMTKE
jgi:membrane fusion protein (multidrug efflux system)